jgi:hypothetical protein
MRQGVIYRGIIFVKGRGDFMFDDDNTTIRLATAKMMLEDLIQELNYIEKRFQKIPPQDLNSILNDLDIFRGKLKTLDHVIESMGIKL